MRREAPVAPAKFWPGPPLLSLRSLEVTVAHVILPNLRRLIEASEKHADDFGYITVARVVNRSRAVVLLRKDVDAEALAAFLPLRDAAVPPTDHQLADAALEWVRVTLADALGEATSIKLKVSIWRHKGSKALASQRVVVERAPGDAPSGAESVGGDRAPAPSATPGASAPDAPLPESYPRLRALARSMEAAGKPVPELLRRAFAVADQRQRPPPARRGPLGMSAAEWRSLVREREAAGERSSRLLCAALAMAEEAEREDGATGTA
jgi:hypothetical protein